MAWLCPEENQLSPAGTAQNRSKGQHHSRHFPFGCIFFVKEKKINKNAYAEESESIWKAMKEVEKCEELCKYIS